MGQRQRCAVDGRRQKCVVDGHRQSGHRRRRRRRRADIWTHKQSRPAQSHCG